MGQRQRDPRADLLTAIVVVCVIAVWGVNYGPQLAPLIGEWRPPAWLAQLRAPTDPYAQFFVRAPDNVQMLPVGADGYLTGTVVGRSGTASDGGTATAAFYGAAGQCIGNDAQSVGALRPGTGQGFRLGPIPPGAVRARIRIALRSADNPPLDTADLPGGLQAQVIEEEERRLHPQPEVRPWRPQPRTPGSRPPAPPVTIQVRPAAR